MLHRYAPQTLLLFTHFSNNVHKSYKAQYGAFSLLYCTLNTAMNLMTVIFWLDWRCLTRQSSQNNAYLKITIRRFQPFTE